MHPSLDGVRLIGVFYYKKVVRSKSSCDVALLCLSKVTKSCAFFVVVISTT